MNTAAVPKEKNIDLDKNKYDFNYLMKCVDQNIGNAEKSGNQEGDSSVGESNARIRQILLEEEHGYNSIKQLLNNQVNQISSRLNAQDA